MGDAPDPRPLSLDLTVHKEFIKEARYSASLPSALITSHKGSERFLAARPTATAATATTTARND